MKKILLIMGLTMIVNAGSCKINENVIKESFGNSIFNTYCIDGTKWLVHYNRPVQMLREGFNSLNVVECSCKKGIGYEKFRRDKK